MNAPVANPLHEVLSGVDRTNLWSLIYAAAASPELRDRWITLSYVAHVVLKDLGSAVGDGPVPELSEILNAALIAYPEIEMMEDFLPSDPRDEVVVRVGTRLVRLFPGGVERPIADVDRALRVAETVDPALQKRLGFGIRDLLNVVLTHVDDDLLHMAPAWPTGASDSPSGTISRDEVIAGAVAISKHTSPITDAERRVLAWLTVKAEDLTFEPEHLQSPFGAAMLVEVQGESLPRWMPLSLLPEILTYSVGKLAALVAEEEGLAEDFARRSADLVRQKLRRFGSLVIGSRETPAGPSVRVNGNNVQWILTQGPRRALLVQVQSSLEGSLGVLNVDEPAALRSVSGTSSGEPLRLPSSRITLPPDTELIPLLIVSTADHIMTPSGPGMTSLSLDDFTWISASAKSELDLYNFARDMARNDLPRYFGFESIDSWEWWASNGKSFFSGGISPSFVSIAPHGGSVEWEKSASLSLVERALAGLDFPAIRDWDVVERKENMPANLLRWHAGPGEHDYSGPQEPRRPGFFERGAPEVWSVALGDVPCAVQEASESWSGESLTLLSDLAGAITFGVRAIEPKWRSELRDVGVAAVVIRSQPAVMPLGDDLLLVVRSRSIKNGPFGKIVEVAIEVECGRLMEVGNGNPAILRTHLGKIVEDILRSAGVSAQPARQVRDAWDEAPPTLTIDLLSAPTARNDLPSPVAIDVAYKSTAERWISARLAEEEVAPGVYRGDDAKLLDRTKLAPIALEILEQQLAGFSMAGLVSYGMEQLERTMDRRDVLLRSIRRSASELQLDWDPIEQYEQTQSEHTELRRANEVLVEVGLRLAPTGDGTVDGVVWGELLAVGNVYLDATTRSENVHHQVRPLAIDVSTMFEISTVSDTEPDETPGAKTRYALDMQSFSRAIVKEAVDPDGVNMASVSQARKDNVDAAMLIAFGSTPEDVYIVLYTLAHWPLRPEDDDAVTTTLAEVEAFLDESTLLADEIGGKARLRAALGMLISTPGDMAKDDWKPWHARTRKRRLLAQPIPLLPNGALVISPHYLTGALSMYRNYLEQGLLPWSQPQAPRRLETALGNYRGERNALFEVDVADLMKANGWKTISNVKETKPERLNLDTLQTEIDVVAGKKGHRLIWILEAKDPATVHATPEIRRSLDNFYLDGSKPSYSTQLGRKLADLKPHASRVAEALGLPPRSSIDPYEVRARFVTRRPVPAAFVRSEHPFSTLSSLVTDLAGDSK
jgi:hypothetical protein